MQFENWAEFFAMGGYAFYVWTSYGITAFVIVLMLVRPDPTRVAESEPRSLLPANQPYNRALAFQHPGKCVVQSRRESQR